MAKHDLGPCVPSPGTLLAQEGSKIWLFLGQNQRIFAISRHPYDAGEGPKYGYFWVEIQLLWQACYQVGDSIWKVSSAPYHILIYGQTLLTAIYALSRHPYGAGRVQNIIWGILMHVNSFYNFLEFLQFFSDL